MNVGLKRILFIAASSLLFVGCMDKNTSDVKADAVNPFDITADAINPQRAAEALGLTPVTAGGTTANCARCHGEFKSLDGLTNLYNQSYYAYQCFSGDASTDSGKTRALACLAQLNTSLSDSDISLINRGDQASIEKGIRGLKPSNLGLYTAAVNLDTFKALFSGNGNRYAPLLKETWVKTVAMPKGNGTMTAQDFQAAITWLMYESPEKEKYLVHEGPQVCSTEGETFVGSAVKAHVTRMSQEGEAWSFKNQANGLKMFGCDANNGSCFQGKVSGSDVFPLVKGLLSGAGEVRKLYTMDDESTYWTRSSADGRYVSYGATPRSQIVDLSPKLQGRAVHKIGVEANYDPTFTPDNLTFMYQGDAHGSRFCNQSMLSNLSLNNIDFSSKDCSATALRIGLYQGMGSSLDNDDIMTVNGGFRSDEGATIIQDSAPLFSADSTMEISRIRQSESTVFEKVGVQVVPTPYIANWMLSPSTKMAVGTVSGATAAKKGRHGGYRIVLTDSAAIQNSQLPESWTDKDTAMLCVASGEKPQFSFDERYLVYYAYEKHDNLVKAAQSSANLFVIDLLGDGKPVQLTKVPKGTFVQFPHFRSDGWVYFSYYNALTKERTVMATDAILKLQN